jgi:hypothetical protein
MLLQNFTGFRGQYSCIKDIKDFTIWGDNINMNLLEMGFEGVSWIHLSQSRVKWRSLVSMVINLHSFTSGSTALCWALASSSVS